jgi:hypothetical protein
VEELLRWSEQLLPRKYDEKFHKGTRRPLSQSCGRGGALGKANSSSITGREAVRNSDSAQLNQNILANLFCAATSWKLVFESLLMPNRDRIRRSPLPGQRPLRCLVSMLYNGVPSCPNAAGSH